MARKSSSSSSSSSSLRHVIGCVLGTALVVQLVSVWITTTGGEAPKQGARNKEVVPPPPQGLDRRLFERPTVAYAVSVTKDGSYMDGAAVLAHSAVRVHRFGKSRYDVDLVAFVAPGVSGEGRSQLRACGYRVLERGLPLGIEKIEGAYLRERIESNGCCGAWELLKLYSWTMTEYHRVVHLDMDALVLGNLDELFDEPPWSGGVKALYTYDWTMARPPWGKNPPTQGGFIVAKPDLATFDGMVEVVRRGDFRNGKGWGGTGAGTYWGGMTIQGLVPYYFEKLHPGTGRAVDNCVYNNMANNPKSVGGFGKGECRDGRDECEDCRLVDVETVKTTHFTICQKPWGCTSASHLSCPYCPLCAKFHGLWFEIRRELEVEWGTYSADRYSGDAAERQGMCGRRRDGQRGYVPLPIDLLVENSTYGRRWRASWQPTVAFSTEAHVI
ncbi:hypothetical protein CTAYLR_004246 [Chrysophaeum taylorii]|uniref:Hexosyltransferase n=1 Tax=Chrysophaeum taylorii TaxID=2483200 RepID=A0AAD7XNK7_9STRA|nr:hypothetical protein CTAYLR_004246 [Chrysophaeum taylorii]